MIEEKTKTMAPRKVSGLASIRLEGPARRLAALLYRRVIDRALAGVHRRMAALLLETARHPILVDCCCGTGGLLRHLAGSENRGAELGVDLDLFALAEASPRLTTGQSVAQGDVRYLPLLDASVHGAAISHALHVLPSSARIVILKEMVRVVRPGGTVVIADYDPHGRASRVTRTLLFSIERLAGGDHYRNYLDFMSKGGVAPLLEEARLSQQNKLPIHRQGGAIWSCCACQS